MGLSHTEAGAEPALTTKPGLAVLLEISRTEEKQKLGCDLRGGYEWVVLLRSF